MISSLLYGLNHAPIWRGEMRVWDRAMQAASMDRLLYLGLHRAGLMGKNEAQLLRRLIRPGMQIVDVGANVGLYSLLLAELAGDEGSVLAFEPEPNLFAMLLVNCARNEVRNVTAQQLALGQRNGRVIFQRSAFNSGDNRLGRRTSAHEPIEVELVCFDDLHPEAAPDFIKIDVQGHELDVLSGMERALQASVSVRVFFEFCPRAARAAGSSAEALLDFFRERDFLLYETAGGKLRRVGDFSKLADKASGHRYRNLLATREPIDE